MCSYCYDPCSLPECSCSCERLLINMDGYCFECGHSVPEEGGFLMSHLFIVKKSNGYSINALFSEDSDGDSYAMSFTCVHRRPLKDDGIYDFYDCVLKGFAGKLRFRG
jgi:hypothetical protein